jgi:hypothetical protein
MMDAAQAYAPVHDLQRVQIRQGFQSVAHDVCDLRFFQLYKNAGLISPVDGR